MSQSEQSEWAPPTGEPHWNGRILLLKAELVLDVMGTSSDEGKQEGGRPSTPTQSISHREPPNARENSTTGWLAMT